MRVECGIQNGKVVVPKTWLEKFKEMVGYEADTVVFDLSDASPKVPAGVFLIRKEPGRELTDLDLAELSSFADKLDASGHEVYAIQFNEHLEELARETGLSIPEIKNRAREYRSRR